MDSSFVEFIQSKTVFGGRKAMILPNWFEYFLNKKIVVNNANRIYVSAWVKDSDKINLCVSSSKVQLNATSGQVVAHKKGWNKIELYAVIPDDLQNQTVDFFVWKMDRKNGFLDNIRIVLLHEKFIE